MTLKRISMRGLALILLVSPAFAGQNYRYLALGDSVAFGYDPTVPLVPGGAAAFTGYPEAIARSMFGSVPQMNAGCPGQTSASFMTGEPDNGCEPSAAYGPGFKLGIGLRAPYLPFQTQMAFARTQLLENKSISVITLSLGGNDLLELQESCSQAPSFPVCVATNLPAVLLKYQANLATILADIRSSSNYKGKLVLVKYFAPSSDPLYVTAIAALNSAMEAASAPYGVRFADGFTAFQIASRSYGGDPCKAGLLVRKTATTCDVHPSPLGRNVLAGAVLLSLLF